MRSIVELINFIETKGLKNLVWNDSDYIKGNDYSISYIEEIDEENFDTDTPILITYNNGMSEAKVFLHEIIAKKN